MKKKSEKQAHRATSTSHGSTQMNTDDANNLTTTAPRAEEITQRREDTKTRRPWAVLSATTAHFMAPTHSMLADRKTKPLPKQKAIARLTAFQWQPITASPQTFGSTKSLRRPTEGFYDTALNEANDV